MLSNGSARMLEQALKYSFIVIMFILAATFIFIDLARA